MMNKRILRVVLVMALFMMGSPVKVMSFEPMAHRGTSQGYRPPVSTAILMQYNESPYNIDQIPPF
jgi:hypothetical protein